MKKIPGLQRLRVKEQESNLSRLCVESSYLLSKVNQPTTTIFPIPPTCAEGEHFGLKCTPPKHKDGIGNIVIGWC